MTVLEIYPEKKYPEAAEFCRSFLHEKTRPRYVLGRNEYAISISECVDIDGFIDDFTSETEFFGKPIVKMDKIPKESMVVSSLIFVMPLTALRKLQDHGFICLDYFKFFKYSGLAVKKVDFLSESKKDIETNLNRYRCLYNRFHDEESRNVLCKLLNFRASGDLNYMLNFENLQEKQYFEGFLEFKSREVFVDAGGFNGQTTIEFIKRCPEYKTIHFFEPDSKNIALASKNLSGYNNIYYYLMGLAEYKRTLRFSSGEGAASKLRETGDVEINVDSIDNQIKESISFIKMDIEGAERNAIKGTKEHILNDHPKLAICCYHRVDDLWIIPEQILSMREDYEIYLRHYTDGLHETVMFFIPKAKVN
jgi:FkbM family methyltransferase